LSGDGYPLGDEGAAVPIWMLCVYMVVLGTVVPFWLIVVSLQHIRASQASVIGMTEPLLASLIAWIALGEVLSPVQLVGAVTVLVGVYLAERYRT
jgi:drug/metabolite transporter (DMT)-like permease